MKSIVELWFACLTEAGEQHHVRIQRDLAYAKSRIEKEGLSFLTIALPSFEKDLLQALSYGVGSNHFVGFRRSGGLPRFLGGFLRLLFDSDGSVRSDLDPQALKSLRQVLLLVSKVELPVTRLRERAAIEEYVRTDQELVALPERRINAFKSASYHLLGEYLQEVESRIWSRDWKPRHASGSLATRESYNSRWSFATWTERLQEFIPWWDDLTVFPSEIQHLDVSVLAEDDEPPVRVAVVPKTMKSPRIIAMEPVHLQYVQQGILHVMTDVLHEKRFEHLAQAFSWLDQDPNRNLARLGSVDGSYATIDLSEASDRVSLELVEALLDRVPYLRNVVKSARSQRALLPDGRVIHLNKFASMGSSLCFPIESMVFFVIASIAAAETVGVAPSQLRRSRHREIRVYGDDIIVPDIVAQNLMYWLEAFGLKVNRRKSFTTGNFRESCGSDWFRGVDVSVFKLRSPFCTYGHQYQLLERTIAFHNRAYGAGWFRVARFVETHLLGVRPRIPYVPVGVDTPALWSWDAPFVERSNPNLQRPEYKTLVFRQVKPVDPLDGYGALKKCLPSPSDEPRESTHLERDGRGHYAGVHSGWTAIW